MREHDLNKLLENKGLLDAKIEDFLSQGVLIKQPVVSDEIKGHIAKAEHNLVFVKDNVKLGHFDWCISGCYYASYHIVLALIMTKGYSSKSHLATLCFLIKEFYKQGIDKEDLQMIDSLFIDYQDLTFYVESKNKREDATYSSNRLQPKETVRTS
jgi:uncharacterized protein (UPF0332 family)